MDSDKDLTEVERFGFTNWKGGNRLGSAVLGGVRIERVAEQRPARQDQPNGEHCHDRRAHGARQSRRRLSSHSDSNSNPGWHLLPTI